MWRAPFFYHLIDKRGIHIYIYIIYIYINLYIYLYLYIYHMCVCIILVLYNYTNTFILYFAEHCKLSQHTLTSTKGIARESDV